MKYIVRALKYFVYLLLMLVVIIALLMVLKLVDTDPSNIFKYGYNSYWQIGLMLLAFSFIYPKTGYSKQRVTALGNPAENDEKLKDGMLARNYKLESETNDGFTFRCMSASKRFSRMWEDRITVTRTLEGYELEGLTRDIVRVASGLRVRFQDPEE